MNILVYGAGVIGSLYAGRLHRGGHRVTLLARGLTVTPFALRALFTWLPPAFAVNYWQRFFATEMADYVFGRHSRAACTEMRELADDCRTLFERTGVEKSALLELYDAIDTYAGQHPSEQSG